MNYNYLKKDKKLVSLKSNSLNILVDEWMVNEIKTLDDAGVKIIACNYDYENNKKSILIESTSNSIVIELGYFPMRYGLYGKSYIVGEKFRA